MVGIELSRVVISFITYCIHHLLSVEEEERGGGLGRGGGRRIGVGGVWEMGKERAFPGWKASGGIENYRKSATFHDILK